MYFNLNKGIDVVKGKNRYLIVDTINQQIFDIDKKLYLILTQCKKGSEIEKISNDTEFLIEKLEELQKVRVGKLSNSFKIQEKNKIEKNTLNMVWLNVTSRCNYKCLHCYENAGSNSIGELLTLSDYDNILKVLTKNFNISCVQITGGEPLLMGENFIESLLGIISKYNIKFIEIYSNLYLLNKKFVEIFKKFKVNIATSLYSQYPAVHDSITQNAGSFNKLISNLEFLKKEMIPFRVGIIIMKQNEKEKDSLRQWVNEKFDLFEQKRYDIVRPVGRALENEYVNRELFENKYFIKKHNFAKYNFEKYFYNKIFNTCWGDKVCIKSNGDVFPCVMSNVKVGNIKNILKVLTNKKSYRFLNKDKINRCKNCEFRYLCLECRAIYSKNKKSLKDKPFVCKYNEKTHDFKIED